MLVVSSPSGGGKTTIMQGLIKLEQNLRFSVSVTTREKRDGEIEGKDYFFVTKGKFDQMAKGGALLEHAKVFGNHYGTPKRNTIDILKKGQDIIYDIDWQGGAKLMDACREDVVSVFILPPSMKVLEQRLKSRASDSKEAMKIRLYQAHNDIKKCKLYDYIIVNSSIDEAVSQVRAILTAERIRRSRIDTGKLLKSLDTN